VEPAAISELLEAAQRERRSVRLHLADGEVLTALVLHWDDESVLYAPLQSSRPERYAVCDSTGFAVSMTDIQRAQLLRAPRKT
jgi:hypothetical protein